MKKESGLLVEFAILILGLALFGVGVYFLNENLEFFKDSIQAEGTVIDIESRRYNKGTSYYPVISFEALDGDTYVFSPETGQNSLGSYYKGEVLMINYNKENPQMARIDSFFERWGAPLAFLITGLLIVLAVSVNIYNIYYRIQLRRELPRTGTRLQLPGRIELKRSRGKSEFVIISDWLNPSDSKMYAFTSEKILYDPTAYINDRLMEVWIDRRNPKRNHYMDISFLPERA